MNGLTMLAEAGSDLSTPATTTDVNSVLSLIKTSVTGVFEIASSAMHFLLDTPLSAFMIGAGFAFSALGLAHKGLRVAKRT